MAVPLFLSGNVAEQVPTAVSDVQDIIDDFLTLATGLTPAWTDGGGGLVTSPVDGDGRFFDLLFTRIAAANLEVRVRDDTGTTICTRRMQIISGPQNFWISLSAFHCWMEIQNATPEAIGAGLLDLSPDAQTSHTQYVWGRGSRTVADALDGDGNQNSDFFMIDNGTPDSAGRVVGKNLNQDVQVMATVTGGGSDMWLAMDLGANFSGNERYAGRCFNMLYGTVSFVTRTLPIGDSAETATFRGTGVLALNGSRIAFRIS